MQHKETENSQIDQGVKAKQLASFLKVIKKLSECEGYLEIPPLIEEYSLAKENIKRLKENKLLTVDEAFEITDAYESVRHKLRNIRLPDKNGRIYFNGREFSEEFDTWRLYTIDLKSQDLVKKLPQKLVFPKDVQEPEKILKTLYNLQTDAVYVLGEFQKDNIKQEDMKLYVDAVVKYLIDAMEASKTTQDNHLFDKLQTSWLRGHLIKLRNLELISSEDAYRIANAYAEVRANFYTKNSSISTKYLETLKQESLIWKKYAALQGNLEALKFFNPDNEYFIRQAWESFLQVTAPSPSSLDIKPKKIGGLTLFQEDMAREKAINLQKQFDLYSSDESIYSNKQLLHLIADFYMHQCDEKKSASHKDKFIHQLSSTLIDILIHLGETDKNIAITLQKFATDNQMVEQYSLLDAQAIKSLVLKKSPTMLINLLTSLHLGQPALDRSSDFGPSLDNYL